MNILLVVHAIVTAFMIGVILLQRSEGGALGIGGSGGGMFTARGTTNFLTRLTAILATIFIGNCILMTVITSKNIKSSAVLLEKPIQQEKPSPPAKL